MNLDIALSFQQASLEELLQNKGAFANLATINREYCYYKVTYAPATMAITSFELNEKKVEKARRLSGFFAIMTHGVDFGDMEAYRTYELRDEQEKYFTGRLCASLHFASATQAQAREPAEAEDRAEFIIQKRAKLTSIFARIDLPLL